MHQGLPQEDGHTGASPGAAADGTAAAHGAHADAPGTDTGTATATDGGHRAGRRRKGGRRKPRRPVLRVLRWVGGITAFVVLGTAGAAYGYYEYLAGKIHKGERASGDTHAVKTKANAQGQTPVNILILGSDSRADPEDAKLGGASDAAGARADVIMIAHLSADRTNMSVVSIPRDTRVDIPRCTDPHTHHVYPATNDLINASLGHGGAGCTLATVQNLTGGLYIDHWLTVDFKGVVRMADVVGGVPVCLKENVDDHPTPDQPGGSHLHMPKGTHIVKGQQALQWLRTRHAFGSDVGRAKAQHMYLNALIRKLRNENYFTSPGKLNKLATTAVDSFAVSSEIGTPTKLYHLGMQLKSIPPKRITMLTMPRIADPEDPQAHYLPEPGAADAVWTLLRNDIAMDTNGKAASATSASAKPTTKAPSGPPAAPAATIPVNVINGTAGTAGSAAVDHRAAAIRSALAGAGFTRAQAVQQATPSQVTTLTYPIGGGAGSRSNALSVARALKVPAADVKPSSDVGTITLTVGADWKDGTDYSKTLPKAGSVPGDADVYNGADTGQCMDVEPVYRW